jgi:four helix bundle protein
MPFKFENLEIWHLAIEYVDLVYTLTECLPKEEEYNLKSQWRRAATSIALNIAEGSTGQSDPEQARFLGLAVRSLIECVACSRLFQRRGFRSEADTASAFENQSTMLAKKIQAMRKTLDASRNVH